MIGERKTDIRRFGLIRDLWLSKAHTGAPVSVLKIALATALSDRSASEDERDDDYKHSDVPPGLSFIVLPRAQSKVTNSHTSHS